MSKNPTTWTSIHVDSSDQLRLEVRSNHENGSILEVYLNDAVVAQFKFFFRDSTKRETVLHLLNNISKIVQEDLAKDITPLADPNKFITDDEVWV